MAMSSGKTSSMAALMLVVAVAAGTCASGAHTQFDIVSNCSLPFFILTGPKVSYTLFPSEIDHVNVTPNVFFIRPVKLTYSRNYIPPSEIPGTVLDELNQLGKTLKKIEISCEQLCFTLYVTYQPQTQGSPPKTLRKAPFCLLSDP